MIAARIWMKPMTAKKTGLWADIDYLAGQGDFPAFWRASQMVWQSRAGEAYDPALSRLPQRRRSGVVVS